MLPSFLIAGASKSGTTSLYSYIRQHPEIYMPYLKEIKYFSRIKNVGKYHKGIEWYKKYFKKAEELSDNVKCGEASVIYFDEPGTAELIKGTLPDVKLIFVLREPIQRAYSNYWQDRESGRKVKENFYDMIKSIEWDNIHRFRNNPYLPENRVWAYIWVSSYQKHLRRYFNLFERENILILLFQEIVNIDESIFKKIFNFLEVDDEFIPENIEKKNRSGTYKSKILQRILNSDLKEKFPIVNKTTYSIYQKLKSLNRKNFDYPPIDKDSAKILVNYFADKLHKIEALTERDLSHWEKKWEKLVGKN